MHQILTDVSDSALRTAIKANYYAFMELLERSPLVDFHSQPGLIRWRTPLPHPVFQGALVTQPMPGAEARLIGETRAYFDGEGVPGFCWWFSPAVDPSPWEGALRDHGLRPDDDPPGMAVVLDELREPAPLPWLRITRVADPATLRVWCETFGAGYELPPEMAAIFTDLLAGLGFGGNLHHYLAYRGDTPIACASLWLASGAAGIYNVATLPAARRQGVGAAITAAPLLEARALGYRVGALQASEMGLGVYQRLGFRHLCAMDHYVWFRPPG